MLNRPRIPLVVSLLISFVCVLQAEVKLPAIFGDYMVLQGGMEVPVWGTAAPGEQVVVSLGGLSSRTIADPAGNWSVKLPVMKSSSKELFMSVRGEENFILYKDVIIGDVWLCSGQSNMEQNLGRAHNGSEVIPETDYPEIRFFYVKKTANLEAQDDLEGRWIVCTPNSPELGTFSAVGFFFGREIWKTQGIPIGLIGAYYGGSSAQSWVSLDLLSKHPELKHYADSYTKKRAGLAELQAEYESVTLPNWIPKIERWENNTKKKGKPTPMPRAPAHNPWTFPTLLYNAMLHPLIPYGIKGVIWYQGESNAEFAEEYETLFPALIQSWREEWGQGDFPFLYVQLASWELDWDIPKDSWSRLRDVQVQALSVPNTAMAVAIDVGEQKDIHPRNKYEVGHRLALAARHLVYGEELVYSGPMFQSLKIDENRAIVSFEHVGSGLMIDSVPPNRLEQQKQEPADALQAFEIAGLDGVFVPAHAVIDKDTVVVSAESVSTPTAVRYAWSSWPEPAANLYNKEGLPASPFNSLTTP